MIRLALIRHGMTPWNRQRRIQGRTDIPLDTDAENDLSRLEIPGPWGKADLVSSPLSRAVRTAELLTGATPQKEDALIEMNWGQWEGRRNEDIAAEPNTQFRHLEDWGWNYRPPGGETPAEVRDRVEPWALALQKDTLAVCHIGIIRILLAVAHRWNFRGTSPYVVKRNRLYVVEISDTLSVGDPREIRLVSASNHDHKSS